MGDMVMGECENRQKKSCIAQTYCKYFEGGYGRLQLGNLYRCHGFFQKMREFEEADSRTFLYKLVE